MRLFNTPTTILNELSQLVRQKRVLQGVTQKALADKANVNISAIRKFEQTGQIGLDSFIKIIYVLDLADTMLAVFKNDIQTPKSIDEIIKLQKKVNDSVTKKRRVRKK